MDKTVTFPSPLIEPVEKNVNVDKVDEEDESIEEVRSI